VKWVDGRANNDRSRRRKWFGGSSTNDDGCSWLSVENASLTRINQCTSQITKSFVGQVFRGRLFHFHCHLFDSPPSPSILSVRSNLNMLGHCSSCWYFVAMPVESQASYTSTIRVNSASHCSSSSRPFGNCVITHSPDLLLSHVRVVAPHLTQSEIVTHNCTNPFCLFRLWQMLVLLARHRNLDLRFRNFGPTSLSKRINVPKRTLVGTVWTEPLASPFESANRYCTIANVPTVTWDKDASSKISKALTCVSSRFHF
jgi:hypothetical protein